MTEEITLDTLVKTYVSIRDKLNAARKEWEAKEFTLKESMDQVSFEIRERMKAQGATSVKTDSGTAMMRVDSKYYPQDWDAFKEFVAKNQAFDLLEKRVAQGALKDWIENNPENVPPGLGSVSSYVITVRKPKETA